MTDLSNYTRYLPPVLWSAENDPNQFLGRTLRIFEKILTGFPEITPVVTATIVQARGQEIEVTSAADASQFAPSDIITIIGTTERLRVTQVAGATINLDTAVADNKPYNGATLRLTPYGSLEKTIDHLAELFDPWKTHSDFLPWLATWIALDLEPDWNEYQKRLFISQMTSIYQQRGLKSGLMKYLDIYVASKAKPRIAIDDGEAIWRASLNPGGMADLHPVAYSYGVNLGQDDIRAVLLHPTAIAVDQDNNYLVTDRGGIEEINNQPRWQPALWKVSSTGEINYSLNQVQPNVSLPQPIYTGAELANPTAVVVDEQNRYYVLTIGQDSLPSAIYRFVAPDYNLDPLITENSTPALPTVYPLDMVWDRVTIDSAQLIILDRGRPGGGARTKVITVTITPSLAVQESPQLTDVREPTAIIMDSTGQLIIADAKEPSSSNSPPEAADLLLVNPSDWSVTSLLESLDLPENPLIFPTGLAWENPQSLIVCDTGVRERESGLGERHRAEAAALYRVDLSQSPPQISRITDPRKLVNPSKIAVDRHNKIVIADRGAEYNLADLPDVPQREWRTRDNEFGVIVLFSKERATEAAERNQIRFQITQIINEQKPGNTSWWMQF